MENQSLFTVENLSYSFQRNGQWKKYFELESLEIRKGKITFILGVSGTGKTTLLQSIGLMKGLRDESSGGDVFFNPDARKTPFAYRSLWENKKNLNEIRRQFFNFVFQESYYLSRLTVRQVMLAPLFAKLDNVSPAVEEETLELARGYMKRLNLKDDFKQDVRNLSGGEKQRLSLVTTLLGEEEIFMADEPTGNLDTGLSEQVLQLISEVNQDRGGSTIIVSHDLPLAFQFADDIILLHTKSKNINTGIKSVMAYHDFIEKGEVESMIDEILGNADMYEKTAAVSLKRYLKEIVNTRVFNKGNNPKF